MVLCETALQCVPGNADVPLGIVEHHRIPISALQRHVGMKGLLIPQDYLRL